MDELTNEELDSIFEESETTKLLRESLIKSGAQIQREKLRDYFAAHAMSAIIISSKSADHSLGYACAVDAYAMADAMIQAKEE